MARPSPAKQFVEGLIPFLYFVAIRRLPSAATREQVTTLVNETVLRLLRRFDRYDARWRPTTWAGWELRSVLSMLVQRSKRHERRTISIHVADDRKPLEPASTVWAEELERRESAEHAKARIALLLPALDERQRAMMCRRYGLNGHAPATLEVVGDELGVTRERVRQIEAVALDAMRRHARRLGVSQE